MPDEVIIGIITERLAEKDCGNGYILDGVPRTIAQAEALREGGIIFDAVVSIEISDETIMQRMSGRRVCESCGASYHPGSCAPQDARRLRQLRRQTGPAEGRCTLRR